ncbi:MAG TPA: ABC transporter substrate-binding protein [Burkholderiales bacterium]|nr:ABC transporter substrate-binding protein [Burkholderiales bacterium]
MGNRKPSDTRRALLKAVAATAGISAAGLTPRWTYAQSGKLKIGLMLPYTGTFAQLGVAITNGFKLAVQEEGGKLGGRDIEYVTLDDESEPSKAADRANQLVTRDKVDVLVGTVHSGVQMGMVKIARESGVLHIIPNAGVAAATGELCAPNIFRTSFANAQTTYPMGKVLADRGVKNVVTLSWKYAAGEEAVQGFRDSFTKGGGKIAKELWLPFPNVEFQSLLTEIASLKPEAVFVFFAGGGAAKFLRDYQAAGLKGRIPLYGSGFLTDGILEAAGDAGEGVETTLHYGDGIETPRNNAFRVAYVRSYKIAPDVYAVQGYDSGLLLAAGLRAVKGDISRKKEIIAAMEKAEIDSPRGKWKMSRAHNPVQDMYLRKVAGKENKVTSVAIKNLDYPPASNCKMAG